MVVARQNAEPRHEVRSNVFLSAVLTSQDRQRQVRVRNISRIGALVDGADLPTHEEVVQLIRGRLTVEARVAWNRADQCGLRFLAPVKVVEWVSKVEHAGQRRVDHVVSMLRRPEAIADLRPVLVHDQDSLNAISRNLAEACERLAGSPEVVDRYAAELVALDAIAQRLECLAKQG